ncbi:MAG: hypothetical protein ACREH4_13780 [Vitreimonas sp.]
MRLSLFVMVLALSACISPLAPRTQTTLVSADASTALMAGERLRAEYVTHARSGGDDLVILTLRHADGRTLAFDQASHTPNDLAAQAPGGPLSQIMGLFGQEAPTLYRARRDEHRGAPFLCGPQGPAGIGVYDPGDGSLQLVGLKQEIQFEQRPDGQTEAVPYSPDQVCARLRFTKE